MDFAMIYPLAVLVASVIMMHTTLSHDPWWIKCLPWVVFVLNLPALLAGMLRALLIIIK